MKKMMMMLAAVLGLAPAALPCGTGAIASAPTGVWVKLEINLHRPKFDCERGFGICLLVTTGWNNDNPGARDESDLMPVKGRVNERRQLIVEIAESELTKYEGGTALPYFRNRNTVTIQDPYPIPESTCRALGLAFPQNIRPGTFPLTYRNSVYTLVIQL